MSNLTIKRRLCPCGCDSVLYDTYIFGDIGNPEDYIPLVHVLRAATKKDVIAIHISTDGGSLDTADMLRQHLLATDARSTAYTYGLVASAGTIIALSCNAINFSEGTKFLIHMPKTESSTEQYSHVNKKLEKANADFMVSVYKKVLSPYELSNVLDGRDLLLSSQELNKRLKD